MANEAQVNQQKLDMANILKLSARFDMNNKSNVNKVINYISSKNMMTSTVGKKYVQRLTDISKGKSTEELNCIFCNKNLSADGIICESCMERYSGGRLKIKLHDSPNNTMRTGATKGNTSKAVTDVQEKAESTVQKFANKVNELAGGEGDVELRFKDLFKNILKHHDMDEAERIFIYGTKTTTPPIRTISTEWPAPWLYSRVGLVLLLAFIILEISWSFTHNKNLLPGMMFVGSAIVPLSVVVFFFETNAPRNISIFRVVQTFFVGGCASLLSTLIIFKIAPVGEQSFGGAIAVGIIEEVGKMIIVAWYINKMKNCIFVLNGLLVGSAVGAGFAVFESAGYAYRYLLTFGYDEMVNTINRRAMLAPGGHVAWAAVTGAAIMIALDGENFRWSILSNPKFLRLFIFPVVLHAIWDMPIYIWFIHYVLIAIIWIILVVLIQNGLKEIERLLRKS